MDEHKPSGQRAGGAWNKDRKLNVLGPVFTKKLSKFKKLKGNLLAIVVSNRVEQSEMKL
jgi:hypothetical protein